MLCGGCLACQWRWANISFPLSLTHPIGYGHHPRNVMVMLNASCLPSSTSPTLHMSLSTTLVRIIKNLLDRIIMMPMHLPTAPRGICALWATSVLAADTQRWESGKCSGEGWHVYSCCFTPKHKYKQKVTFFCVNNSFAEEEEQLVGFWVPFRASSIQCLHKKRKSNNFSREKVPHISKHIGFVKWMNGTDVGPLLVGLSLLLVVAWLAFQLHKSTPWSEWNLVADK